MRLGEILVQSGCLNRQQVEQILAEQRSSARPFGAICEQRYGIDASRIEQAWATQYAYLTRSVPVNLDDHDPAVESMVSRRQAWQFRILPIRMDDGALQLATTEEDLPRALRFACRIIGVPVFFVLVSRGELAGALMKRYPMVGMDDSFLECPTWERGSHHGGDDRRRESA